MSRSKYGATIQSTGISYVHKGLQPFCINVYFNGRLVGYIKREPSQAHGMRTPFNYYYRVRGNTARAEKFQSVEAVKLSIEGV